MRVIALLMSLLLAAVSPVATENPAAPRSSLRITCVGHEGYLLSDGTSGVLLDSFIGPGETERDTLIRRSLEDLMASRSPFGNVAVALVSHPHDDHFDARVAGRYLEAHPATVLAATPAILTALDQDNPGHEVRAGQLSRVDWDQTRRSTREVGGVKVDFIRFAHEASQFYPDEVALHIVHIHGQKVLHGADVEMLHAQFSTLKLEQESLDVAFLPYSFLASPGAAKVYAEHIGARRVIAMHLPAAGVEEAKAVVRKQFPNAIFLIRPLDSLDL